MILACAGCDSRYDVTGYPVGQQFRCRCGTITKLEAPSPQAGLLACPHCGAGVAPTVKSCAHCAQQLLLKACPRCLSRVFHGHKHCPDCGTELSVAATATPEQERMCPRCESEPLGARRVEDLVVDECLACHGLFMDQTALKRIVTERKQARAEALLGAIPKIAAADRRGGKLYVKCPVCKTLMNRRLFAAGSGVIIDVCRDHGVYFDEGELPKIIEFVQQGGLEHAEKKQIERMKEDQRRADANAAWAAMMAQRSSTGAADAAIMGFSTRPRPTALVDFLLELMK
ncbi:MAG TPA: zf-TFIIB domain-containing protein [Xanthomonadales bacterium]|nr:zf-TFIIB domain-containing protein [Xanthomonadales bacterium]